MSSILKALRRLEEERARQSSAAPEIAASLLRDSTRRRVAFPWIWPVVIAAVAVVVMTLLWSWRPEPSQPVMPVAPPPTIAGVPAAGRGGVVVVEEVIDQRRPVLQPPAPAPVLPLPAESVAPPPAPPLEKSEPLVPPLAERRSPVVSAIAWQDDASARMAVVDGLPVMAGEAVGNARIQEIQRDRVLFVEAETLFFVPLAQP